MSIVVKKIRKNRYAYLAYRSGSRVVHKYLGAVSDPEVQAKMKAFEQGNKVPKGFAYLFWDTDVSQIDVRRNARYIIEKVLEFGDLKALDWIQRLYPTRKIIETCEGSRKISEKSMNFWRTWFDIAS